jgi:hypothetical protein
MLKWIARRIGRDRRWISDPVERDAHDRTVRARLSRSEETDDATHDEQRAPETPPRESA